MLIFIIKNNAEIHKKYTYYIKQLYLSISVIFYKLFFYRE